MSSSIRQRMIQALANSGDFLSGQALADMIGCSRTAIWKHIEELRKDGIEIEAVRKKGYRLVSLPDKLTENELLFDLKTEWLGRKIHYFESIESTQTIAHQLAENGAPAGTIVIADEQTGGKGRLNRTWYSAKQKGIWMSLIIRPKLNLARAPQFTLITAVAIVRAIVDVTGLEPEIKWPNDVLINDKKCSGILTEVKGESDQINYLIIGIGINVNHTEYDFSPTVQSTATSIAIESGSQISRKGFLHKVLSYFEKYYDLYLNEGFAPIKLIWESYATGIGKKITARTISGTFVGTIVGITNEGVLKLEEENGNIQYIYSADIELNSLN